MLGHDEILQMWQPTQIIDVEPSSVIGGAKIG